MYFCTKYTRISCILVYFVQDLDDWGCTICVLKSESNLLYALICIRQLLFFYDTKLSEWWILSLLWVHCSNYIQHHLSKRLTFCPFMYFSFSGMEAIHLFENDITPPPTTTTTTPLCRQKSYLLTFNSLKSFLTSTEFIEKVLDPFVISLHCFDSH